MKIFDDGYWDTSNKICMVPTIGEMEIADTLLFEIAWEVEFWAKKFKDHEKTKALVRTLSTKVKQLEK